MRIDRLQREFDLALRRTGFPLHPEIPEEGMALEELFAGRRVDSGEMMERLVQVAGRLGLPFAKPRLTFNSRCAQELAKWAEAQGKGEAFRAGVYRAYFAEGRNIARVDELAAVAAAAGLAAEGARQALEQGTYRAEVDADWARCRALGINAVPTYVAGGRALSGFRDYDELARLAESAGARPLSSGPADRRPG